MDGNGGPAGTQMGSQGTVISSTPSGNVDIHEGQDQETVPVSGTHLDGVVDQTRTTWILLMTSNHRWNTYLMFETLLHLRESLSKMKPLDVRQIRSSRIVHTVLED
jgi:hypothetical protein